MSEVSGVPWQPAIGPWETAEEAREVKSGPEGRLLSGLGSRAGLGALLKEEEEGSEGGSPVTELPVAPAFATAVAWETGPVPEALSQPPPTRNQEQPSQFPNDMASSSVSSMELLRNAVCIIQLVSSVQMLLCFKVPTSFTGCEDESCAL